LQEVRVVLELLVAAGIVIVVSAMCSLFEAVLLSTPMSHVETMAREGRASGRIFRGLRQNVDRPLSAILSLNTIANTGGAAVAGAAFVKAYGEQFEVYFTVVITLCVLFFSEVVPKTVGAVHYRFFAGLIARPLQVLVLVFRPLIVVCRLLTGVVSRSASQPVSEEELVSLAQIGLREGSIESGEARVIQNILALKSKTVKDAMTPRTVVFSLSEEETVQEAIGSMWQHSRVPVYATDFEDVVGIVLRSQALEAIGQGHGEQKLSSLMREVHFVVESATLDQILPMFLERKEHMFVAVDEYGGMAGVVTLEDVMEEILGRQIVDESDQVTDLRELARSRRQETLRKRPKE
jgi:CBS domain containing-hemolysin-like protein